MRGRPRDLWGLMGVLGSGRLGEEIGVGKRVSLKGLYEICYRTKGILLFSSPSSAFLSLYVRTGFVTCTIHVVGGVNEGFVFCVGTRHHRVACPLSSERITPLSSQSNMIVETYAVNFCCMFLKSLIN